MTRRQQQILDFIRGFIAERGYSPSLEEIGQHFGLSSVATVHKHVGNLVRLGLLRRGWNQNRSIEVVEETRAPRAAEIPLLGRVADGRPIESMGPAEPIAVPGWMVGRGRTYALRVETDAFSAQALRRGDLVVVEERRQAVPGQLVVAMVHGEAATLGTLEDAAGAVRLAASAATEGQVVPPERVDVRGVVRAVLRKC